MGQNCCQDQSGIYNPFDELHVKANRPALQKDSFISSEGQMRNFPAVKDLPEIDEKVQNIEAQIGPFVHSSSFKPPQGIPQAKHYALNTSGLVYLAGGEWFDGLPHGKGRLIYPNGSTYTGYFEDGVANGEGRFVSCDGWWYEGQIRNEQAEGIGHFQNSFEGFTFEGQWSGDLPDGKGVEMWRKEEVVYDGSYLAGKKHGIGKYKKGSEWTYRGNFDNNEMTGSNGIIRYKNGQIYTGDCQDGKKQGFGTYRWVEGQVYEGGFKKDLKEGRGKYTSADGKVFDGIWHKGMRNGRGSLTVNGQTYEGEWRNDEAIEMIST